MSSVSTSLSAYKGSLFDKTLKHKKSRIPVDEETTFGSNGHMTKEEYDAIMEEKKKLRQKSSW